MSSVNLRVARERDIEAIARLHPESWRVAYRGMYRDDYLDGPVFDDRLRVWRGRLTAPTSGQLTIVAERADAIAGFACAFADEDPHWGTLLDNIHVSPHFKRSGIGRMLLRRVALWARQERPAAGLYRWVSEANAPARRVYQRVGSRNA